MSLKSHLTATCFGLTWPSSGNCSPIETAPLHKFVCQCIPCYCILSFALFLYFISYKVYWRFKASLVPSCKMIIVFHCPGPVLQLRQNCRLHYFCWRMGTPSISSVFGLLLIQPKTNIFSLFDYTFNTELLYFVWVDCHQCVRPILCYINHVIITLPPYCNSPVWQLPYIL
jgi:hypothetical protein